MSIPTVGRMFLLDSEEAHIGRVLYRVVALEQPCNKCGRSDGIRLEVLYNDRSGLDVFDGFIKPNDRLGTMITSCGATWDAELRNNKGRTFRQIAPSQEAAYLQKLEEW